jgi:hypothetical protein
LILCAFKQTERNQSTHVAAPPPRAPWKRQTPIFCWEKSRNRATADFGILEELKSKSDARISAGVGKIDANNWFLSMTWGRGTDHLPISCQERVSVRLILISLKAALRRWDSFRDRSVLPTKRDP